MRYLLTTLFLCALFLSRAQETSFYTPETVPNPKSGTGTGYVSDPDGILAADTEATLNGILAALEDSSTAQVAVVILNSIGEANPKDFTTRLFNLCGIGQADKDNGLLIFTVMDQRRTEFETGYGLEGVLPDVVCYRIGMQELVPYFQKGEYGQGLIAAVSAFRAILEQPATVEEIRSDRPTPGQPSRAPNTPWILLGIYGLLSLILPVIFLIRAHTVLHSREELYDKYIDLKRITYLFLVFLIPVLYLPLYLWLRAQLKVLRYAPRFSRKTGAPMRLLSEAEENPYLERGQVTEEEIGSVDYDVWVTEAGDDLLILRYARRFTQYSKCPSCGFITYYQAYSEVTSYPTYTHTGTKKVVYQCKNCRYEKVTRVTLPKKTRSSSSSGGGFGGSSSGGSGSWGGGSSGGGGAGVSW